MARIELAPEVLEDFDRFFDDIAQFNLESASQRIEAIVDAVQVLGHSPLIGRKYQGGTRELVIGQGMHGYVALYRYVPGIETVFVLAIRHQREAGYK